jgi:hypothetical protein
MLGKTAKLNWGLGHKSLKTIYEGALVPLMTYGAPVWEEAIKKQTPSEDAELPNTYQHQNNKGVQNHIIRSFLYAGWCAACRNRN